MKLTAHPGNEPGAGHQASKLKRRIVRSILKATDNKAFAQESIDNDWLALVSVAKRENEDGEYVYDSRKWAEDSDDVQLFPLHEALCEVNPGDVLDLYLYDHWYMVGNAEVIVLDNGYDYTFTG